MKKKEARRVVGLTCFEQMKILVGVLNKQL